MVKKGLGRGLGNLISDDTLSRRQENDQASNLAEVKEKIVEKIVEKEVIVKEPVEMTLDINLIEPNRKQPRKNFDEDALEELCESIKQYGILEPLLVQKKEDYYEIIAGERRWRAARKAGIKEVPVIIREYTEQEIVEISLIENIQRENLNPIEEALAFERLVKEFHMKQDEVAERVSKSRVAVTNSMRLLKLDKRVQDMLVDEMLTAGHARSLLAVEDGDKQYSIAMRIFDEKLSVREIEKLIKDIGKEPPVTKEKKVSSSDLVYREYEEKLKTTLGSKVVIRNKDNNKGKIEIDYGSREEFERIIDLINKGNN